MMSVEAGIRLKHRTSYLIVWRVINFLFRCEHTQRETTIEYKFLQQEKTIYVDIFFFFSSTTGVMHISLDVVEFY